MYAALTSVVACIDPADEGAESSDGHQHDAAVSGSAELSATGDAEVLPDTNKDAEKLEQHARAEQGSNDGDSRIGAVTKQRRGRPRKGKEVKEKTKRPCRKLGAQEAESESPNARHDDKQTQAPKWQRGGHL